MTTPTVPDLGPFVLVQAGVFIATVGSAFVLWWRGMRKKFPPDNMHEASAQYFFDGPLKVALYRLEGAYRTLGEMRRENEATVAEFRGRHETELNILRALLGRVDEQAETLKEILRELQLMARIDRRR